MTISYYHWTIVSRHRHTRLSKSGLVNDEDIDENNIQVLMFRSQDDDNTQYSVIKY